MIVKCNVSIEFILERIEKSYEWIDDIYKLYLSENKLPIEYEEKYRKFLDTLKVHSDGLVSIFIPGKRIDMDEEGKIKELFLLEGKMNGVCLLREENKGHRYAIGYNYIFDIDKIEKELK